MWFTSHLSDPPDGHFIMAAMDLKRSGKPFMDTISFVMGEKTALLRGSLKTHQYFANATEAEPGMTANTDKGKDGEASEAPFKKHKALKFDLEVFNTTIAELKKQIPSFEDECNHLSKLKKSFDEIKDFQEKKVKGDVEKSERKIEGDLKTTQEAVSNLDRVKAELNQTVACKEKEASALAAKIEDEVSLGSKYTKQVKELQARPEELSIERSNRAKAAKNRSMQKKEIEDIAYRLEEAGSITSTQVELNNKKKSELAHLKSELEELNIGHEGTLSALRMKHNNTMTELDENIDNLNTNKVKSEKDKRGMEKDLADSSAALEDAVKSKAEMDKQQKLLQGSMVDEMARDSDSDMNEAESTKKKREVERRDLNQQIEELENGINQSKAKSSLMTQLKAHAEIQLWRSRYETEGMSRIDGIECDKSKLQSRIIEAEETVESLQTRIANNEESRNCLAAELEEISMEYDRVRAATMITDKRGQNYEKVLEKWQMKAADVAVEVEAPQTEVRNFNSELFRLKAAQDEAVENLDNINEIKDLLDRLEKDGGRSIQDLDKQRRNPEQEKGELQTALVIAEVALEQDENKALRTVLELSQVRQEIDMDSLETKQMPKGQEEA